MVKTDSFFATRRDFYCERVATVELVCRLIGDSSWPPVSILIHSFKGSFISVSYSPSLFSPSRPLPPFLSYFFVSHHLFLSLSGTPASQRGDPHHAHVGARTKAWKSQSKGRGGRKKANYHAREKKNCNSFFLDNIRRKEKGGGKERASVRGLADPGHVAETPRISAFFVRSWPELVDKALHVWEGGSQGSTLQAGVCHRRWGVGGLVRVSVSVCEREDGDGWGVMARRSPGVSN